MPEGYIAVSHVICNLVKKIPVRLSSCWTPISGSFDSIVEEDEELNDEEDLESAEATKLDNTGTVLWIGSKPCYYYSHRKKIPHYIL